ncbi:uncharacterized protein LOC129584016 isoform X2 [Paramacrobiotus metropolitanus]|uniref:uncharacterized protein LOC129584016 isoform X2 n=1 Tax=Paramacrobiotus metropolitanus TaxID=2943436 RepID=UPI002445BDBB|nr:uncharacterized protein LOC129584016 isoform X2 [Paramacrobiotus metropolitanus]
MANGDVDDLSSVDEQYAQITNLHPNPVGYLHEICSKRKEDTPQFTVISYHQKKATTVFFVKAAALGIDAVGSGSRKNNAKAVAAYKILAAKNFCQPVLDLTEPKVNEEVPPEPAPVENHEKRNENDLQPLLSSGRQDLLTEKKLSVFSSIPPFNTNNPTASVNWILNIVQAGSLRIEYQEAGRSEEQSRASWICRVMVDEEVTVGEGASKRQALREAAERMHNYLLSLESVQLKLETVEEKLKLFQKPPVKTETPAGWGRFQHSLLINRSAKNLPTGAALLQEYYQDSQWSTLDDRLALLATKYSFRYYFEPWPQTDSFKSSYRSVPTKSKRKKRKVEGPVLLTMIVTFAKTEFPLGFSGMGGDDQAAKESALRKAERYFSVVADVEKISSGAAKHGISRKKE